MVDCGSIDDFELDNLLELMDSLEWIAEVDNDDKYLYNDTDHLPSDN